jgi:hypothetical protein
MPITAEARTRQNQYFFSTLLVYIAHQLDVLGRMTAPMEEEQDGKP